jgi:L-threonylcarbamoyladenylate synthase
MAHFYSKTQTAEISHQLTIGNIGIMPTDTVYGLVGVASNPPTIERIYQVKKRDESKPMIILVSQYPADLTLFNISVSASQDEPVKNLWPGPVSILFPCHDSSLTYLHRGTNQLALRLPDNDWLTSILKQIGPIVATSANEQGLPIATSLVEASQQFDDSVDFYVDGGEIEAKPSKLIAIAPQGTVTTLRS